MLPKDDVMQVYWKMWENSPHVGHMKDNPEEYQALWLQFLEKVGFLSHGSSEVRTSQSEGR